MFAPPFVNNMVGHGVPIHHSYAAFSYAQHGTISKTVLPMERDSYRRQLLLDYLRHGRNHNGGSLQSFDVADSIGYINSLFDECDDGDDGITDAVNADQVDGIHNAVNPNDVDGVAGDVNADEVDGLTDDMNQDTVDCFTDGAIDDMGTATSTIGNNEATTAGLLVATKRKRKPTDLSLRFLGK
jgi:hypothetical protein